MTFKMKTLALTLLGLLMLGAATVSTASAAQFTANSYPTTATATLPAGGFAFNTAGGSVECATHFEGTLSGASETLTITPKSTACQAFGFLEATMNMNGCDWVFRANQEVDLECPSSSKIVIVAGSCEVQVSSTTGHKTLDLTNNGAHIDFRFTLADFPYTVTKDGFLCPFQGTGSKANGTVTSNTSTLKPVSGGSSISVDP